VAKTSHQEIVSKVRAQMADVFEESKQGVYVYLDDANKVCNKRFASMLGYSSPKEWSEVNENFPEVFVSPKDRHALVSTYQRAMNDMVGSTISISWRRKDGKEVRTTTMLVPFVYEGHRMALHFITQE